jgi:subtilisin family serine protease
MLAGLTRWNGVRFVGRTRSVVLLTALLASGAMASGATSASQPPARQPLAPLADAAPGRGVPGSYIVTVSDGINARGLARRQGVDPTAIYDAALNGFAARLSPAQLERVRRSPEVVAVEANQVVHAATTQPTGDGMWGLDRIDQRRLPFSKTYKYTSTGAGVTAYVIDSGTLHSHPDFGDRAKLGFDTFGGTGRDCNGHGTHVAGTIGGTKFGVAKSVRVRTVRVLDCEGSGTTAGVIDGIDFVRRDASGPSVANMSISGPQSAALDSAAERLVDSGVAVSVAAGNEGWNACRNSPGRAVGVLTVAAIKPSGAHASFSNYGRCVELYAPGVAVRSDWLGGATATFSGTSMASPHVAGVLALRMSGGGVSAAAAQTWVRRNATPGTVTGEPTGTADLLLFKSTL